MPVRSICLNGENKYLRQKTPAREPNNRTSSGPNYARRSRDSSEVTQKTHKANRLISYSSGKHYFLPRKLSSISHRSALPRKCTYWYQLLLAFREITSEVTRSFLIGWKLNCQSYRCQTSFVGRRHSRSPLHKLTLIVKVLHREWRMEKKKGKSSPMGNVKTINYRKRNVTQYLIKWCILRMEYIIIFKIEDGDWMYRANIHHMQLKIIGNGQVAVFQS